MRNVLMKVIVVSLVMLACIASGYGQTVAKTDTDSAFDRLDPSQLDETYQRFGMDLPTDGPRGPVERAKVMAKAMGYIRKPSARLAEGEKIVKMLNDEFDAQEEIAEKASEAAEKVLGKTAKRTALVKAAKAALYCQNMIYLMGDIGGRRAIEPYSLKMTNMQDNHKDRKIVLDITEDAIRDLEDVQNDLKDVMQDWHGDMATWMIMGSKGDALLRDAQYWSSYTLLNRAMALGDEEAFAGEREVLIAASQAEIAKNPTAKPTELQKRKEKLDADLAQLASKQKKRTAERRMLLENILDLLPRFVSTRRFGVSGDARRLTAIAHRELGQYDQALKYLEPELYKDAKPSPKLLAAQELPITLVKKGDYDEAARKITDFRTLAENILRGKKEKLAENKQAQIDLRVAMLKEYLARRQTAVSTTDPEREKHIAAGQAAMIEFLDKYEDNDGFKRDFINFFGNRLLYTTDISKLSSVQLYIAASGAAAEDEPEKRRDMLEMLLSRQNDPAVKKLAPEAYWQLAMTMNQLTRSQAAADNFMLALGAFGPDHPKAPTAAKNASLCMRKYVDWYENTQQRNAPRTARLKYITAMQESLKYNAKYPDLELSEWYYSLGRQCNQLSQESNAKEALVWMKRASDAFAKVPTDPPSKYFSAQDLWLDLRYRALKQGEMDAAAKKAEARKLRTDYATFIKAVEKHVTTLANPEDIKSFNTAAAWGDYTRVKLLGDQLGQNDEALAEVVAVMKKWPDVEDMITQAIQWKIQNLVDQGEIVLASAELQAYMKKNPAAVADLIEQVIDGIKTAIDKAVTAKAPAAKLAGLRASYLTLARGLYDPIKGKSIVVERQVDAQRLKLTQLWIDALIQNDRAAEAMTLAAECRRIFNAGRDAKRKLIDAKYARVLVKCKAAIGLPAALNSLVKGYIAALNARAKDKGYDDFTPTRDASAVLLAQKAMNDYKGADKDKKKRQQSTLSLELRTGYREIMRRLKNRIPVDLMVEWDIAKCYAATGKYNDSLEIYTRLIKGTNPRGDANMKRRFWRLNLEYCQTYLKALSTNKAHMAKLVLRIEIELTKIGGADKGGFKAEFFAIQEQARRLSQ